MDSATSISELRENILNAAGEALNGLIPEKSKERYCNDPNRSAKLRTCKFFFFILNFKINSTKIS
jgi:hypothetical protein